jgi:sigma-B regulation protein RsbU (phosphoserine phosphatase)
MENGFPIGLGLRLTEPGPGAPNQSVKQPPPKDQPRLFRTLTSDIHEVTADFGRRGVGGITATFEEIEAFYLDEASRRRLAGMGHVRRTFRRFFWLIKSLLMKLTPARRIMLAFALLLLLPGIHLGGGEGVRIDLQAPLVSLLIVLVVLMLELKDKLIARNELVAGRAVQLALMPPESPAVPGWDIWLYTQPANDVGGDLVDHLKIDERHHGIALGDVAGKALPAALLMVKLQATLRALVPLFPALSELGSALNRILHRDGLPNRFATLVYLALTTGDGHIRYLNAGHVPPLVIRGSAIEELKDSSIALGFIPEAEFAERAVSLAVGDVLVIVSDGVIEAMNAADEFFGDDRLRAALSAVAGQPAGQLGQAILSALQPFVGEKKPHDDVSIVVVRRQA